MFGFHQLFISESIITFFFSYIPWMDGWMFWITLELILSSQNAAAHTQSSGDSRIGQVNSRIVQNPELKKKLRKMSLTWGQRAQYFETEFLHSVTHKLPNRTMIGYQDYIRDTYLRLAAHLHRWEQTS